LEAVRERTPAAVAPPSTSAARVMTASTHSNRFTPEADPAVCNGGVLPGRSRGRWYEQSDHTHRLENTVAKPFTSQRNIVVAQGIGGVAAGKMTYGSTFAASLCPETVEGKPYSFPPSIRVDWGGWQVVFKQLSVFELVGCVGLSAPAAANFRINDKGGADGR